jgi:6-phosphofructokinase 1
VLGHIQRGGSPTAFDRVLGTRLGLKAMELVHKGEFGKMVALRGTEIVAIDIAAVTKPKLVTKALNDEAKVFFG